MTKTLWWMLKSMDIKRSDFLLSKLIKCLKKPIRDFGNSIFRWISCFGNHYSVTTVIESRCCMYFEIPCKYEIIIKYHNKFVITVFKVF